MTGALLGLLGGAGLLLALTGIPSLRQPTLGMRVDPWLGDTRVGGRTAASAIAPLGLVRPLLERAARSVDDVLGGSAAVARRLALAGEPMTLEEFREQQVIAAAAGMALGVGLILVGQASGFGLSPMAGVAVTVALVLGGILGREWLLGRAVDRRRGRISAELPVVAELLALAVAAGEGLNGALDRVARLAHGDLATEIREALADTRSGTSLVVALQEIGTRTAVPSVVRLVDGMATAIERGTPLADVLRAQAADARETSRRELLEAGGRKEIAMLAPVVFLVLPVVVLFAIYPALVGLSLVVH